MSGAAIAMTDSSTCIVQTACGAVAGREIDGLRVFRAIAYARAPVGALRFRPPEPVQPWPGVHDACRPGPIAPQTPSRLASVMGDIDAPQSEDCLTLDLYAPAALAGGLRPVVVWLHGGAFSSGAGSLPWYSGEALARRGDLVFVAPNFRLGALGFLCLPGVADGNMGLLDALAALRWVVANIAAFGGDPRRITLMGQSSGGSMIDALIDTPQARRLFQRAIVQSAPLGRPRLERQEASAIGERYRGLVDERWRNDLQHAPVAALLQAQGPLAASFRPPLGGTALPFMPVLPVPADAAPNPAAAAGAGSGAVASASAPPLDILVGSNADEMRAFYAGNPALSQVSEEQVRQSFAASLGERAADALDHYRSLRPGPLGTATLCDLYGDLVFRLGALRFAQARQARGDAVFVYQFDWASTAFGACHCFELPFIFGNLADWRGAPMMQGIDEAVFEQRSRSVQDAWLAFIRHGKPGWPGYDATARRATMRFADDGGVVDDPAGAARHPLY